MMIWRFHIPITIDVQETDAIELQDLIEYLIDNHIDTMDQESLLSAAPMLKKLSNNRTFLSDIALDDLKNRKTIDDGASSYGPQVIMLHSPRSIFQSFFLRANIWPAEDDHIMMSSDAKNFSYHFPHDHAFNFLTVGYLGPGYTSNYYRYNYDNVAGFEGEHAGIEFVETASLSEGKIMLYRALNDIHDQKPGDSLSISVNIMENSLRPIVHDQYSFDSNTSQISGTVNPIAATSLLPMLSVFENGNGLDFLHDIASQHPSGRIRCSALNAIANSCSLTADALGTFERGAKNDMAVVRGFSRLKITKLSNLLRVGESKVDCF